MNDEIDGPYSRIWLHLVKEGGWHTCREVFSGVEVESVNRSRLLAHMREAGYISQKDGNGGQCVYGVTNTCRIPRFVSVGQVAQAVGG